MFISKEELTSINNRLDYLTRKVQDLELSTKYYETSSVPSCSSYYSYFPKIEVADVKTVLRLVLDKLGLTIKTKPAEVKETILVEREVETEDDKSLVKTEGFTAEKEDNNGGK